MSNRSQVVAEDRLRQMHEAALAAVRTMPNRSRVIEAAMAVLVEHNLVEEFARKLQTIAREPINSQPPNGRGMPGHAAILAKHGARSLEEDARYPGMDGVCAEHKIVLVPDGQSLDFDEGMITRRWLHPYLEGGWHLSGWLRVEQ